MDAIEAILTRRSIRKFAAKPVSEQTVHELLNAAMNAPSSANGQPWQFVVITDRKILDDIPKFHPYSTMLKEAPLAFVVCGDLNLTKGTEVWVQDCSAATENLLIASHALGLGAVWLGVYPLDERVNGVRKLLNLPAHIMPLCIIAAGYPAETKPTADRFKQERVHLNYW